MNILYVILEKNKNKGLSKETTDSIKRNNKKSKIEFVTFEDVQDNQLYYKIFDNINTKDVDFISLLPNGSTVNEKYEEILKEYVMDVSKVVLMPLILLQNDGNIKGILNSTVFNTNFTVRFGVVDHEFALQQTDTILFGCLIPKKMLEEKKYYKEELKMYQHFHLLNAWTKDEKIGVIGIPKLLVELNYDLSYEKYTEEEKLENYKLARQSFVEELKEEEEKQSKDKMKIVGK